MGDPCPGLILKNIRNTPMDTKKHTCVGCKYNVNNATGVFGRFPEGSPIGKVFDVCDQCYTWNLPDSVRRNYTSDDSYMISIWS